MDQEALYKKSAGKKHRDWKWKNSQRICQKHNLPCHWADVCPECVRERISIDRIQLSINIDPEIMQKLLIKEEKGIKNIKQKTKMKSFFV